ncbi:carbamoyltransferase HypF [Sulfuricystis thermophila]|uniref:carbamoyltransferase HypF n=1 Tax=Sulfuricystis thermophila TaxID=2496847 RepID=UPI0024DF94D9|nr:carbamoyltransferase HypF [Sulfuricystis thermophila]
MPEAHRIRVKGVVQGVGFRPFVWRLAHALGLQGWVKNDAVGVDIHAEGERLDEFAARLRLDAPPLARVDAVVATETEWLGCRDFLIVASAGGKVMTAIGHDTATCADCLAELFDPANRRHRHPFITCTHCGPRYTVTRRLPYDRPQTSLAPFPLCPDCAREYTDPADRRFHAETICCPNCGPRLQLLDAAGRPIAGDPLAATLALLEAGKIVAIKGLGGFHLACDATNCTTVAALRARKQREEKPFAVMVADVAQAARYAKVGAGETALLEGPERPIVLLEKKVELAGIAPGLAEIGLMLPVTPIQFLLFHDAPEMALVMTSANPHGEPLVIGNDEALARLSGIADAFLLHDRDIVVRCDDSVRRETVFIRRARGYVPRAIRLPREIPPVLAVGGWFKNTVCVTRGDEAFVSQHVGDLDNAAACGFFEETVAHLLSILEVEPQCVAHDLHPDFHSTRFAAAFAAERGIHAIGVQHHHAHIAAVCAEHGVTEPVLGLALDGVGLGADGTAWGGELLRVECARFERLGHLRPLALPGGDVAAREPWRMAAAALHALGHGSEIATRFADEPAAPTVAQMLARGFHCPTTSSAGRLFDAVAGLLGVRRRQSYEGQAAMLLEGLAARHGPVSPLADGWRMLEGELDLLPLFAYLEDCEDAAAGAALFHATFSAALVDWVVAAAHRTGLRTVAAAGGCLLNRLLSAALRSSLAERGVRLIEARALPPNDGGLSLGQAWVAGSRGVCGRA